MQRRNFLEGVAGVAAATSIAGCLDSSEEWNSEIRTIVPLTGPLAALGPSIEHGVRVAIEESDVETSIEDFGGNPDEARSLARETLDENIPSILGPISSDINMAIREFAEREEIPFMPTQGVDIDITQPGTSWTSRLMGHTGQIVQGLLEFYSEMGVSSIGIIAADYSYPQSLVEQFEAHEGDYDVDVDQVYFEPLDVEDFSSTVNQIEQNENIEGLQIAHPGPGGVPLINQLQGAGLVDDLVVCGDFANGATAFIEGAGDVADGFYHVSIDLSSSAAQNVVSTSEEMFGRRVDGQEILSYDVTRIVIEAIENADEVTPETVNENIRNTDYTPVGGFGVDFDEDGANQAFELIVNQWVESGGELEAEFTFQSSRIEP